MVECRRPEGNVTTEATQEAQFEYDRSVVGVQVELGEFTISSLLNFETLQVVINLLGKRNASIAVAVSLAALLLATALLFLLSFVDQSGRRGARVADE